VSRFLEYAREAIESLWRNRTRSILTMLGMIIGTSSVIAVFGVSRAASTGIEATISSFGAPAAFIAVDDTQNFPKDAAIQYRDVAMVREQTAGIIADIEPNYSQTYRVRVGDKSNFENVVSATGYAPADKLEMQDGRKIDQTDIDTAAHVLTVTPDIADKYFPNGSAVGQYVRINGSRFQLIGVYSPLKGSFFNSIAGGTLLIPYSTFHGLDPGPADSLTFYGADGVDDDTAIAAVKAALQHIHGPNAQYISQSGGAAIGIFQNVLTIVASGLSAIGAVALVVAGIGVMNIMLVSVVERTREIGIRKSIGASRTDIALQFLMEAVILSVLGGGTGMGLGLLATIGAASLISRQLGAVIIPYLLLVSLAMAFSIGIGMTFGMYPALRAARLDPIEALRS
jgi:putative ABC transport system permease protein